MPPNEQKSTPTPYSKPTPLRREEIKYTTLPLPTPLIPLHSPVTSKFKFLKTYTETHNFIH
jgi:hypothetical protein